MQAANLENNQQKAHAILHDIQVAVANPFRCRNRFISHAVAGAEKRHGAGGRVGKTVRQQM